MNQLQVRGIKHPSLRCYKNLLFTQVSQPLQLNKQQFQLNLQQNLKLQEEDDQLKKQPKVFLWKNKQVSEERKNFLTQFLQILNLDDNNTQINKQDQMSSNSCYRESCSRFTKQVRVPKDFLVKKSRSLSQMKQRSSSMNFKKDDIQTQLPQKKKKNVHFFEKVEFLVTSDEENTIMNYKYFEPLK